MSRQEEIRQDLLETEAVQYVAGALSELAAKRIKEVRDTFKNTRPFFDELRTLYALVKSASLKSNPSNLVSGGKTLLVAITSNHRFYGALNRDVMDAAREGISYTVGDLLVVGKTGSIILDTIGAIKGNPRILIFNKDLPNSGEMKKFIMELSKYDRIIFYYPQFITILTQHISSVDFSEFVAESPFEEGSLTHIFEPELSKLLVFFENEIRRLLIVRVIKEAELARTALRLVSMSRAEQEAGERVRKQRMNLRKTGAEIQNMRLLETFAGILKWKHKLYE
jgi:F-type H+-transporting ATPase subunit gamma